MSLRTGWRPRRSRNDGTHIQRSLVVDKTVGREQPSLYEEGMLVLMLNESGLIMNCNAVAGTLLVVRPASCYGNRFEVSAEAVGHRADAERTDQPRLRFLSRIGHLLKSCLRTGSFPSRVFFNEVENYGRQNLCLVICRKHEQTCHPELSLPQLIRRKIMDTETKQNIPSPPAKSPPARNPPARNPPARNPPARNPPAPHYPRSIRSRIWSGGLNSWSTAFSAGAGLRWGAGRTSLSLATCLRRWRCDYQSRRGRSRQ